MMNNMVSEELHLCYCDFGNPTAAKVVEESDYELGDIGLYAVCQVTLDMVKYGYFDMPMTLLFEEDHKEHDCLATSRGVLALTGSFLKGMGDVPFGDSTIPALWCEGAPVSDRYGGRGSMVSLPCKWGKCNFKAVHECIVIDGRLTPVVSFETEGD